MKTQIVIGLSFTLGFICGYICHKGRIEYLRRKRDWFIRKAAEAHNKLQGAVGDADNLLTS